MKSIWILLLLAAAQLLASSPALASSVAVGTCRPKLPSRTTIQDAINASASGGTVLVCPGTYAEQITIAAPLTLEGATNQSQGRAIITVPPGGLSVSSRDIYSGNSLAAQLLVFAGTPSVNILDITFDGSNGMTSAMFQTGILYDSGTSGTVRGVTVRNESTGTVGLGIMVQNSLSINGTIKIENSAFYDGMSLETNQTPPTLNVTVTGNLVSVSSGNGVPSSMYVEGTGIVSGNVITDLTGYVPSQTDGIVTGCQSTPAVTGNTITNTQRGIATCGSASNAVRNNVIWNSSMAGITISQGATIQNNIIVKAPVGIEFSCFTGTISGNSINDAGIGIDSVPASFNLVNSLFNVDTTRTGGC